MFPFYQEQTIVYECCKTVSYCGEYIEISTITDRKPIKGTAVLTILNFSDAIIIRFNEDGIPHFTFTSSVNIPVTALRAKCDYDTGMFSCKIDHTYVQSDKQFSGTIQYDYYYDDNYQPLSIAFERLENNNLPLPRYGSENAAALDLAACLTRTCYESLKVGTKTEKKVITTTPVPTLVLSPGNVVMIPTGLKFEPNTTDLYLEIHPRSSSWNKGFMLANTIGIIDNDYRGEIFITLRSMADEEIYIEHGQHIAQAIPCTSTKVEIIERNVGTTKRGEGGFGSTS